MSAQTPGTSSIYGVAEEDTITGQQGFVLQQQSLFIGVGIAVGFVLLSASAGLSVRRARQQREMKAWASYNTATKAANQMFETQPERLFYARSV